MKSRASRKAESHERILGAAVRALKERGLRGVNVAEVMADADMTVGGFYAHFPSKNALLDAALRRGLRDRRERFAADVRSKSWSYRVRRMLERYVSAEHRDDVSGGCPLPSVAAEVAREGVARIPLSEEIVALVDTLAGPESGTDGHARQAALGAVALMVGSVTLARAVGRRDLSDEILSAASEFGSVALAGLEARSRGDERHGRAAAR